MKRSLRSKAFAAFLSLLMVQMSTAAWSETKGRSPLISLDVTEANLEDVLKILSQQAGVNFITSEGARDKTVTMYLDQVPADLAIQKILEANHLVSKPVEGANLYLISESQNSKIETMTKVIRLKHARVISSAGELSSVLSFQSVFGATSIGATTGSTGTTSGSTGTGSTATATPIAAPPSLGGGTAPLSGSTGGTASGGIVNIVRSLLSEHGTLGTDPRINALIITEIPERFAKIEKVINDLDVPQPQVYIHAEILEVSLDTLRRIGVEYGDSAGQVASFVGPKRDTYFPFAPGLFDFKTKTYTLGVMSLAEANILFKILATSSDVKFLARPRLLALSNETATIQIVSNAATSSVSTSQATTGTITTSFERNLVGTTLRVTPIVHGDKEITMAIQPEISRVATSSKFSNALDPTSRSALTTVTVSDGQTVMIAGLISRDYTDATRKLPGLGDLPIVGAPFRRTEIEDKNTEIIIFIRPQIVRNEEEAATLLRKPLEREQTPLSVPEQRFLEGSHDRELRRRAVDQTMHILLR